MTPEQKIDHLGDVIRMMAREIRRLSGNSEKLVYHLHGQDGRVVVPLSPGLEEAIPYWLTNPLREDR